jgi:hypothetical protein
MTCQQAAVPGAVSLTTSNFNKHYAETDVPKLQHVFMGATHQLLLAYCRSLAVMYVYLFRERDIQ